MIKSVEPDFDKEIDALLRKETVGRTITISEFGGLHLDADEITAFAEKKVPPGVRDSFIEHFAACDRCRKVLLNAAWLNSEEEPVEQTSVAAPAGIAVPWHRRLFMFPNLAAVLGGLVILFAGFIGISVYSGLGSRSADVSQAERISEMPAASGPSENEYAMNSNAASTVANSNSAANMTNTSASNAMPAPVSVPNMTANAANAVTPRPALRSEDEAKRIQEVAVTAAPPPARKEDAVSLDGVNARGIVQEKRPPAKPADQENRIEAQKARPMPTPATAAAAPRAKTSSRSDQTVARAAESDLSLKKIENLPAVKDRTMPAGRKQVQGRTFELRQGAWYETTYRGQGTINVRRNTENYRKLDRGLRTIAESLIGTVVTIWNGKAYRIY